MGMGAELRERVDWVSRLLALACYLGLAPLVWLLRWRREDAYVEHHAARALTLLFLLGVLLLLGLVTLGVVTYVMVYQPEVLETVVAHTGDGLDYTFPIFLALWVLVGLVQVGLGLAGSVRDLPLLGRLARKKVVVRLGFAGNLLFWAGAVVVTALAAHATSLTRRQGPASVYVLYDAQGWVPAWVVDLACYHLSLAASERWGPGSIVVGDLDECMLDEALTEGRMVFLWCHGGRGRITASRVVVEPWVRDNRRAYLGFFTAADGWKKLYPLWPGKDLQFVYNSACEGGQRAAAWQLSLAPAEVVTFNRHSGGAEHILWLWFRGPDRLKNIKESHGETQ
jgi:hypothetical protein